MPDAEIENMELVQQAIEAKPEVLDKEILAWDKNEFVKLQPFIKEHYWAGNATINIFRVAGTQHPDYIGMTWIEFLQKGKRMGLNLRLYERNPGYYNEHSKKDPTMYFQSIDGGELFIGQDGNHRSAIARAAFYFGGDPNLYGVEVNDYRIDWALKKAYEDLRDAITERRLPYYIEPVTKLVKREDTGGWMLDRYQPRIRVINAKKGEDKELDLEGIKSFASRIKKKNGLFEKILSFI